MDIEERWNHTGFLSFIESAILLIGKLVIMLVRIQLNDRHFINGEHISKELEELEHALDTIRDY